MPRNVRTMPEGVPCLGIYENQGSSGPSAYLNAHAVKALDIRESECVRAVRVKGEHYLKRVGATTARPGCSLYSNRPGAAGRTLGTSILRKAGVTPGYYLVAEEETGDGLFKLTPMGDHYDDDQP